MSENQINVFCKNCNSVIYVKRELTVEEQSDTKDQTVDFVFNGFRFIVYIL